MDSRHAEDLGGGERILILPEISERTRMPQATLRYKRHRGEAPFLFKMGRRLVAYERDVDEYIRARRDATRRTQAG